jgi:hypothetical protein
MRKILFPALLAFVVLPLLVSAAAAQDEPAPPAPAPAPAPAPVPTPVPAPAPAAPMVEKAQVICDGKVKTDGVLELVVAPQGGTPMQIRVTLQKKMDKQEVCRDIAKELSVALGEKFDVDEDGNKVKIEAEEKDAKFSLVLGAMTATGASVEIKLK